MRCGGIPFSGIRGLEFIAVALCSVVPLSEIEGERFGLVGIDDWLVFLNSMDESVEESDYNALFKSLCTPVDEVCDNLYIGNLEGGRNSGLIEAYNIKYIVQLCDEVQHFPHTISYLSLTSVADFEHYDISQHFDETYNFISENMQKANVLVHW
jgi:hypothetical protein